MSWAGLWRQLDPRAVAQVLKVKAHQTAPPPGSAEPHHVAAYANAVADVLAGGRAAEAAPSPFATDLAARHAAQHRALAVAVAQRLVQWQPLEGSDAKAARLRRARVQAEARGLQPRRPPPTRHPLVPHGEGWRCQDCQRCARSRSAPVFARGCELLPSAWRGFLAADHAAGHVVWSSRVEGFRGAVLVFCSRCGAYSASGSAGGLGRLCPQAAVSVGAAVRLARLRCRRRLIMALPLVEPVRLAAGGGREAPADCLLSWPGGAPDDVAAASSWAA